MADTTRSGADGHDERGLLIRELSHRAKNVLQSISAILSLEASRAPNAEARAALDRAMERVRSMAAVQTLLYDGTSDLVVMREYLCALCSGLSQSLRAGDGQVVFDIDCDDLRWPQDDAGRVGMIVAEVVMNALKHAFPAARSGHVGLSLHPVADRRMNLRIADDGVGFDGGTKTDGLGSWLVSMFASELSGEVRLSSRPGKGCVFTMTFVPPAEFDAD